MFVQQPNSMFVLFLRSPKRKVVLLENVKCGSGSTCYNGRTFSMNVDSVRSMRKLGVGYHYYNFFSNRVWISGVYFFDVLSCI